MSVVVHLVPADEWPGIDAASEYRPATLESGGFIHCAAPDRTVAVAEALFAGRDDLLAVCLDTDALDAPVEYGGENGGEDEADESGDTPETADADADPDSDADGDRATAASDDFPHVYGPINPEAVVAVVPVPREDDGDFSLPEELRELA